MVGPIVELQWRSGGYKWNCTFVFAARAIPGKWDGRSVALQRSGDIRRLGKDGWRGSGRYGRLRVGAEEENGCSGSYS